MCVWRGKGKRVSMCLRYYPEEDEEEEEEREQFWKLSLRELRSRTKGFAAIRRFVRRTKANTVQVSYINIHRKRPPPDKERYLSLTSLLCPKSTRRRRHRRRQRLRGRER